MNPILTPGMIDKEGAVKILDTTIFSMSMSETDNTTLCLLAAIKIANEALKRELAREEQP